jgi:hypothetical protein
MGEGESSAVVAEWEPKACEVKSEDEDENEDEDEWRRARLHVSTGSVNENSAPFPG